MKTMMLLFAVPWLAAFSAVSPQGVYGKDHRLDIYQLPHSGARGLADSTVAMISKNVLEPRGNSYVIDSHASSDLNLCPGEQFIGQPTLADCSGTLIGEDLVLTAGHCISPKDCNDNFFVFGYQMNSADSQISEFPQDDVYSCKEVLARRNSDIVDFALVRLDRSVRGHSPAKLAAQNAAVSDTVFAMGYPSGLPLKHSGESTVSRQAKGYFVSNLDTFSGNSGSGVFSAQTLELVGVLVRGGKDYDYDRKKKCYKVHVCLPGKCDGEEATNLNSILEAVP